MKPMASRDRETRDNNAMVSKRRVPQTELKEIDPRDYDLLRKFVSEQGKILPARFTGATPPQQRTVARAIRRARVMGLLR
jgi:small subunit ribosomal protein S18